MIELSELHDCEKCHGKIVSISLDALGVSRCGYCNEVVRYDLYAKEKLKEIIKNGKKDF